MCNVYVVKSGFWPRLSNSHILVMREPNMKNIIWPSKSNSPISVISKPNTCFKNHKEKKNQIGSELFLSVRSDLQSTRDSGQQCSDLRDGGLQCYQTCRAQGMVDCRVLPDLQNTRDGGLQCVTRLAEHKGWWTAMCYQTCWAQGMVDCSVLLPDLQNTRDGGLQCYQTCREYMGWGTNVHGDPKLWQTEGSISVSYTHLTLPTKMLV